MPTSNLSRLSVITEMKNQPNTSQELRKSLYSDANSSGAALLMEIIFGSLKENSELTPEQNRQTEEYYDDYVRPFVAMSSRAFMSAVQIMSSKSPETPFEVILKLVAVAAEEINFSPETGQKDEHMTVEELKHIALTSTRGLELSQAKPPRGFKLLYRSDLNFDNPSDITDPEHTFTISEGYSLDENDIRVPAIAVFSSMFKYLFVFNEAKQLTTIDNYNHFEKDLPLSKVSLPQSAKEAVDKILAKLGLSLGSLTEEAELDEEPLPYFDYATKGSEA